MASSVPATIVPMTTRCFQAVTMRVPFAAIRRQERVSPG